MARKKFSKNLYYNYKVIKKPKLLSDAHAWFDFTSKAKSKLKNTKDHEMVNKSSWMIIEVISRNKFIILAEQMFSACETLVAYNNLLLK